MRKLIALLLALTYILVLVGCASKTKDPSTPTGYPDGEIQQPQMMYHGQVYLYFATGFDEPLPDGYELVGSISFVDHDNEPTEDFHAARVDAGQEVYASEAIPDTVYLKYENGYAQFSIRK